MKYKVGDKVRLKKELKQGAKYNGILFVFEMEKFKEKIGTIECIDEIDNTYKIKEFYDCWYSEEMLEPVIENKQFTKEDFKFGDIVTVRNGYKYIYIPQKNKFFNSDGIGFMHFNDFNDLLESIGTNALDIMKVERRTYIYYSI